MDMAQDLGQRYKVTLLVDEGAQDVALRTTEHAVDNFAYEGGTEHPCLLNVREGAREAKGGVGEGSIQRGRFERGGLVFARLVRLTARGHQFRHQGGINLDG